MEEKWDTVLHFLRHGSYPEDFNKSQRQNLRRYASKFQIKDGDLLYEGRRKAVKTMEEARVLFREFHSSPIGVHSGIMKTRAAMCARFYWPGMTVDIENWVLECYRCQKAGKPLTVAHPLQCITVQFDDVLDDNSGDQLTVQELKDKPSLLAILKAEPNPTEITPSAHVLGDGWDLQPADDLPRLPPAGLTKDVACENDCRSICQKLEGVANLTSYKTEPNPQEIPYLVYTDEDQQTPLDLCAVKLENTRRIPESRTSEENLVTSAPTAQQGPSRQFINNQCTPVDRTVLEALREMDLKITYLTSLVESLVGGRQILPPQQDEEEMNVFPLNSMETLEDLEKRLLNNGLKQRMTNTLSLSGGHTMKKTIWRIASKVFTPNLAKSLNWCGRGHKRGLKQTACGQLIIAAAVKNSALPAPTEAEAEKCLKDYLRLAPARR